MIETNRRIKVLDALRGVASLAVCWTHFTNGNPSFLADGIIKSSGAYLWMGVDIFFVVSGFIIPFALHRSEYKLAHYFVFIVKRLLRLDPPYLVAIIICISLGFLSSATPGFNGEQFQVSIPQFLLHFCYVNVFFGYKWFNPVFWTLAIEFQYYLILGLLFPLICSKRNLIRISTWLVLSLLPFLLPSPSFVFHYLFFFLIGISTFQYWVGLIDIKAYALLLILFSVGNGYVLGGTLAITGIATACVIAFVDVPEYAPFKFLGKISYSLYLMHVPIGSRVINLSLRFVHNTGGKIAVLAVAVGLSIAAAYMLCRLVEGPSQRWSSSVKYNRKMRLEATSDSNGAPIADTMQVLANERPTA